MFWMPARRRAPMVWLRQVAMVRGALPVRRCEDARRPRRRWCPARGAEPRSVSAGGSCWRAGRESAETVRRKRRTLVNSLNYAVDLGEFSENPLASVRWQKPRVSGEVAPALSQTWSKPGPCSTLSRTSVATGALVVGGLWASARACTSAASGPLRWSAWSSRI